MLRVPSPHMVLLVLAYEMLRYDIPGIKPYWIHGLFTVDVNIKSSRLYNGLENDTRYIFKIGT